MKSFQCSIHCNLKFLSLKDLMRVRYLLKINFLTKKLQARWKSRKWYLIIGYKNYSNKLNQQNLFSK